MATYVVKSGDSLSTIADAHGLSIHELLDNNLEISNPNLIYPGQVISIPEAEDKIQNTEQLESSQIPEQIQSYKVKPGDTLSAIAATHGALLTELLEANPDIENPNLIRPGQLVRIPTDTTSPHENEAPALRNAGDDADALGDGSVDDCVENCSEGEQEGATDVSDEGLDFIGEHEGFVDHLYEDPAGHCTIGYGHLLHHGECTQADREIYPNGITEEDARDLLRGDAQTAVDAVNENINAPLNQNQFDALTSFTFNLGAGNLANSDLRERLNNNEYDAVADELDRWVYAGGERLPGLVNRRADEGDLFNTPIEEQVEADQ